jgi:RNA polymerase sigma-70 factor (ECF subfamily)
LDKGSIGALIEREYSGLRALLRMRTRDPQLAEDLLNDAIVITLEHSADGRITNPDAIGGYVFQVALNLLRNHRRKFADRIDKRAELDDSIAGLSATEQFEWAGLARELINALPVPRDREILTRFYLNEEDKEAICRDVGISPLHFDKVHFRARERLRSLAEERGYSVEQLFHVLLLVTLFSGSAYLTQFSRPPSEVNATAMTARH